eukprot:409065-Rhodomonas_salina.1
MAVGMELSLDCVLEVSVPGLLCSYARSTRCPVLTARMVLPGGIEVDRVSAVSYTHLRAHETEADL